MITTEIKATLTTLGAKFSVKFEMDITDHTAREITLAVAELFNDQPDAGEVIRTEKAKTSLKRQAEIDQGDIFREKAWGDAPVETDPSMIEYHPTDEERENIPPEGDNDPEDAQCEEVRDE